MKFILKLKIPKIAKAILNKHSSGGGINIPDFKLYSRAIRIKKMVLSQNQIYRPKEKRIDDQNIRPANYSHHLVLRKFSKNTHWTNDRLFNK
jgi:hypothetical protein